MPFHRALVPLLCLLVVPRVADAVGEESVRRLLLLTASIAEEYREALDDAGNVVRPIEIEEARLLLAEARQTAGHLDPEHRGEAARRLTALAQAIEDRATRQRVGAMADALGAWLGEATGIAGVLYPATAPSAERGRRLYAAHCTECHGAEGRGDGPTAATLAAPPADFADPEFRRAETPLDFAQVIAVGKRLGGMPAWGEVLSTEERWDAVAYVWSLGTSDAALAEGQGLYLTECVGCHGVAGDGRGTYAQALAGTVPDLTALEALAGRTDAELFAIVSGGVAGTPMPGFAGVLDEGARWRIVAYMRTLALDAAVPTAADAGGAIPAVALAEVRRLVDDAVAAHRRGADDAVARGTDAYLRFEPVERRLGAVEPDAVTRVETAFLAFRVALAETELDAVADRAAAVHIALDHAALALAPRAGSWGPFLQSATIILREGVEVVLIIGALLTWVARSGHVTMRRPIWAGTLGGVLLSLLTAVVLGRVLSAAPATAELLEGVTMLCAAVVLFWVSYWIVSKAEAERWQRYIRGKVERALASGSALALAATAFLAVYREGFETVLFYQALVGGADGASQAIVAGFLVGSAALAVVALLYRRIGHRLPLRPFFLGTGGLLYAMAVIFAGKGVFELQEAGVVGVTLVSWAPHLDALGVYPTGETLAAQGVLLLCVALGLVVMLRGRSVQARLEPLREELG